MKTLKYYLKKAQEEKWALGQFNFSTLEQLRGIFAAVKKLKSPVILGTSEGESEFLGLEEIIASVEILKNRHKISSVFLNLDHGKDIERIKRAIALGYPAVHFDGSKLPLEKNIKYAKEVVKYAHRKNVLVEGEVGAIGTDSSKIYKKKFKIREKDLTCPEEAERFIEETGVDSLAVSIGTFHGVEAHGKNPRIRLEKLKEIKKRTGNTFLVLHGGSGTRNEDIKKAIKLGIVKININTELRVAWRKKLEQCLKEKKDEVKPYRILPEVSKAIQKVAEEKILLFGSKNKL